MGPGLHLGCSLGCGARLLRVDPVATCHGAQRLTEAGPWGGSTPAWTPTPVLHSRPTRSERLCVQARGGRAPAPALRPLQLSWHDVRLDTLWGTMTPKGSEGGGGNVEGSTQAALRTGCSLGLEYAPLPHPETPPAPPPTLVPPVWPWACGLLRGPSAKHQRGEGGCLPVE